MQAEGLCSPIRSAFRLDQSEDGAMEGCEPIPLEAIRKTCALLSNVCHAADRRDYGIQEQTGGACGTSQHADGLEFGSAATVTGELNHVFALRLALQPPSRASSVPSLLHAIAGRFATRGGGAKAAAIVAASAKELRRMGTHLWFSNRAHDVGFGGLFANGNVGILCRNGGAQHLGPPVEIATIPGGCSAGTNGAIIAGHASRPDSPDPRATSPRLAMVLGRLRALPTSHAHGVRSADHPLGPDASSDVLRQSARCTKCGRKCAVLGRPIRPFRAVPGIGVGGNLTHE
jgi:hypothetical protein